jgi:NADP-dependent 3-hydroxy acid dehydrogenase YdfG
MVIQGSRNAMPVVAVVGACGGIGRATAALLRDSGWALALIDNRAADLAALSKELGRGSLIEACSIANATEVEGAFDRIARRYPAIEAVVNAAGLFSYRPIVTLTHAEWDQTIDVNLTGTFNVCKAALPLLRNSAGGRIVNVISIAATHSFSNQAAYCASKAGALALTRVLALELRDAAIGVTAILPGGVDTPLWDHVVVPFDRKRMLQPDDVAQTIRFVLQQPASVTIDEITVSSAAGPQ